MTSPQSPLLSSNLSTADNSLLPARLRALSAYTFMTAPPSPSTLVTQSLLARSHPKLHSVNPRRTFSPTHVVPVVSWPAADGWLGTDAPSSPGPRVSRAATNISLEQVAPDSTVAETKGDVRSTFLCTESCGCLEYATRSGGEARYN